MPAKPLAALVLLILALGTGCSLLPGDTEVAAACGRALTRSRQMTEDRVRVLDRTDAVTEMDPVRVRAVLAHRDEVQRAVFGPIARIATRAERRAAAYQRHRGECRRGSTEVPDRCRDAFTQSGRVERTAAPGPPDPHGVLVQPGPHRRASDRRGRRRYPPGRRPLGRPPRHLRAPTGWARPVPGPAPAVRHGLPQCPLSVHPHGQPVTTASTRTAGGRAGDGATRRPRRG